MDDQSPRIAVAWSGLPVYAAAMLRAGLDTINEPVVVLGTPPAVPAVGMEQVLGREVIWFSGQRKQAFGDLGLRVPELLFVSGWNVPAFRHLAAEVKRAGGSVIVTVDNSYRGDLRQRIGAIVYRLVLSRLFDHAWVPGASAERLMRSCGMPAARITTGLYSSDTSVFGVRTPIQERGREVIYIGQLIERKNVLRLQAAFSQFHAGVGSHWKLSMWGSGPLRSSMSATAGVDVNDFASPGRLAAALNRCRALVLPSHLDHWPLVVHEAAACGCLLILSSAVGSIPEFATADNARIIDPKRTTDIVEALEWLDGLSEEQLVQGSRTSVAMASRFTTTRWATIFRELCTRYLQEPRGGRRGIAGV